VPVTRSRSGPGGRCPAARTGSRTAPSAYLAVCPPSISVFQFPAGTSRQTRRTLTVSTVDWGPSAVIQVARRRQGDIDGLVGRDGDRLASGDGGHFAVVGDQCHRGLVAFDREPEVFEGEDPVVGVGGEGAIGATGPTPVPGRRPDSRAGGRSRASQRASRRRRRPRGTGRRGCPDCPPRTPRCGRLPPSVATRRRRRWRPARRRIRREVSGTTASRRHRRGRYRGPPRRTRPARTGIPGDVDRQDRWSGPGPRESREEGGVTDGNEECRRRGQHGFDVARPRAGARRSDGGLQVTRRVADDADERLPSFMLRNSRPGGEKAADLARRAGALSRGSAMTDRRHRRSETESIPGESSE